MKNKLKSFIIVTLMVCFSVLGVMTNTSAQPVEDWVARYEGSGIDRAEAIAVDSSTGNVYVTGTSLPTSSSYDYVTIAYNSSTGNQLWLRPYDADGYGDHAYAIALDPSSGNVYVTGGSYDSGIGWDYATIAYDSSGNELWTEPARYNGPSNLTDEARAIAVDASGNVYVTGWSQGGSTGWDYATVAYNSSGTQLWVARYDGPANGDDFVSGIAVDSSTGNVYVTGRSPGIGTSEDYATVAYDSSGNELWVRRYNAIPSSGDHAYAIAVDASGNVYVTGTIVHASTSADYTTVAYDSSGNELWTEPARYNGPLNGFDEAHAIAIDSSSCNVYVTGVSAGNGTDNDYATVAYNSSGTQLWVARYDGPANNIDFAFAIALDSSGNVYVTGGSSRSETDRDYATIAYDSSGNELWVARYEGPAGSHDRGKAIAVDSSDNVYVTGVSAGIGTEDDYATIKYTMIGPSPEEQITEIIEFFEESVTDELIVGEDGPFWDADSALTRMGQLLDNAARFIENDRLWAACINLRRALRRCDGEGDRWWNQDFVSGDARDELAAMIEGLMIDLGCRIF